MKMNNSPENAKITYRIFILLSLLLFTASCSDNITNIGDEIVIGITILPGDVELRTQEEVNLLRGLREIRGRLSIGPSQGIGAITDLTPLLSLENVGESIRIYGNLNLTSLDGLNNLSLVSGDFSLRDNPLLTNLHGLGSLGGVQGISIYRMVNFQSFEGWQINSGLINNLNISECDQLADFHGLENVEILNYLGIQDCNNLASLEGLSGVTQMNGLSLRDV
ncbi:MAG: hypothetical protein GY780_05865, partial [bacterium]|nr:hypothetical protein [bacterium]